METVKKLVIVFDILDNLILSKDTMEELDIVQISYTPAVKAMHHIQAKQKLEPPP